MLKEKRNTSTFAKKLNKFFSEPWKQDIERQLVKSMYKYKSKMESDEEQGKQYLQKVYDANMKLIEDDASNEFKQEFSNLINEYKTDSIDTQGSTDLSIEKSDSKDSKKEKEPKLPDIDTDEEQKSVKESEELFELQDETKYFNKRQKKLYSDQPYISENKKSTIMITREHLNEFFFVCDNDQAIKEWDSYTYTLFESLQDDMLVATSIIKLHNLDKRADQYFNSLKGETVKENYLYRQTGEYKYKVKLNMNPYADKESCIYFDNKDTAENYAKDSKGKYEYIGTESLKEGISKNAVELLIEKLKSFNWYGNLNSSSLKEATEYISEEKEINKLVEKCGKLGEDIYNKYCPWKKTQRLKEEFGGTAGFTLDKDSVGYNTNPMNVAIEECDTMKEYGSRSNQKVRTGKVRILDGEDKLEETVDSLDDAEYDTDLYVESLSEDNEQLERMNETDQIMDDVLFDCDTLTEEKYPWNDCIKDQKKEYGSKNTAEKVCGSIKAKNESRIKSTLNSLYESVLNENKNIKRRS